MEDVEAVEVSGREETIDFIKDIRDHWQGIEHLIAGMRLEGSFNESWIEVGECMIEQGIIFLNRSLPTPEGD